MTHFCSPSPGPAEGVLGYYPCVTEDGSPERARGLPEVTQSQRSSWEKSQGMRLPARGAEQTGIVLWAALGPGAPQMGAGHSMGPFGVGVGEWPSCPGHSWAWAACPSPSGDLPCPPRTSSRPWRSG